MKNKLKVEKYKLQGDSEVVLHKVYGETIYLATVKIDGVYPAKGKIAKNFARSEYLYLLEGSVKIAVNDKVYSLGVGENLLIEDGDKYFIKGQASLLVLVRDGKGGNTKIIKK